MSSNVWMQRTIFIALAVAAVVLAGVASRESTGAVGSDPKATVLTSSDVFSNLLSCEIPGLQERVLGRGARSTAYAGEFASVPIAQLRRSNARIYLYIVSGTGVVKIGDKTSQAQPGDFFVIPKQAAHVVSSNGAGVLRGIFFEDKT